jgi:PAS domain S-box-containing protein
MRVIIVDATVDERRLLAGAIKQACPAAEVVDGTMPPVDPASIGGQPEDVQAAALFPLENPNPVLRVARDGTLLFANPASDRLLAAYGVARGGPLPGRWQQVVQEILADGQRRQIEVAVEDGFLELDCVPVLPAGYVNVYGRDVTERKHIEDQLRQSEERSRDLIRHAPTGIYEVDFRTGRFRTANDAMCEILGYRRQELIGMSAFDLLDDEGALRFADRMRRTLAGEMIDPAVEYRVKKRDGEVIYAVLSTKITYRAGQPDGAFVIAHDVTERRRAAEALQEARDRLEQQVQERTAELVQANEALRYQAKVLENVNDAIVAYSAANLRVTAWNHRAEEQYGWAAAEALGAYAPDMVGSQTDPETRAAIVRSVAETGRWQGELRHTRRDGTPIIVWTTSMALRDEAGRVVGHVTANRDITVRKRMESELRASRARLQSLSRRLVALQEKERYEVANQLYNDEGQRLAALLLGLGRLQREMPAAPATTARIEELIDLADGVLADMHSLAVNLRPASLDRLGLRIALGQALAEFGRRSGVNVDCELDVLDGAHLPAQVETNVFRIVQEALANVAHHARATSMSLTAIWRDRQIVLILEDDGIGFDDNPALGERGLGLLAMHERAESVGGSLSIESTPGKGTTLYIQIPEPEA